MSYFMCWAVRLTRTEAGRVLVEMAGRDNNVVPFRGEARFFRNRFHKTVEIDPADPESAAQWAEGMAREYDAGSIKESGRWLPGDSAYRLWAGRLARAGIPIRQPRLSTLFYDGAVPPNIAGATVPTDRTLSVTKGQRIDQATAVRLGAIGASLRVGLPEQRRAAGRLVTNGAPDRFFVLAHRKRRRGWDVSAGEALIAEESFSGEAHWARANRYGPPIAFARLCHADAAARDGVAICGGEFYLATHYGTAPAGAVAPVSAVRFDAMAYAHKPIAVFAGAGAAEMLGRLRRHIPEIDWEIRSSAALARRLIDLHPELSARRGPEMPDERAQTPVGACLPASGQEPDL